MIVIAAGALLLGMVMYADEHDPFDGLFGAFFGAAFGFMAAMLAGLVLYTGGGEWQHHSKPLVSLADGSGIQGHFFLGSGSVDQRPVYTWYEQNGSNSYVRRQADADAAAIHYLPDGKKPYYVHSVEKDTHSFLTTAAIDAGAGTTMDERWDFYIPRGSIVRDYTLDNK